MMKRGSLAIWLVAVIGLIWNGMGLANFAGQIFGDLTGSMPDSHRAIIETRPFWATAGFGVGVLTGVIGALLLAMRNPTAVPIFVVSFVAMVIQSIHTARVGMVSDALGGGELVMYLVMPLIGAVFLLWFARMCRRRNWF